MVAPLVLGAGIGAATSLLGGFFNRRSASKTAASNLAQQREFAQMGVRWKVADARAAGINPLAALGASTHSFQSQPTFTDHSMADAGQDISRAIQAKQTVDERNLNKLQIGVEEERLKQMQLETVGMQYKLTQQTQTPPMPESGYNIIPNEIVASSLSGIEAGQPPGEKNVDMLDGNILRVPGKSLEEAMESAGPFITGQYATIRANQYLKAWFHTMLKSKKGRRYIKNLEPKSRPGYHYKYNPWLGTFQTKLSNRRLQSTRRKMRMRKSH